MFEIPQLFLEGSLPSYTLTLSIEHYIGELLTKLFEVNNSLVTNAKVFKYRLFDLLYFRNLNYKVESISSLREDRSFYTWSLNGFYNHMHTLYFLLGSAMDLTISLRLYIESASNYVSLANLENFTIEGVNITGHIVTGYTIEENYLILPDYLGYIYPETITLELSKTIAANSLEFSNSLFLASQSLPNDKNRVLYQNKIYKPSSYEIGRSGEYTSHQNGLYLWM